MNAYKMYNLDKEDRKETGRSESDDFKTKRALRLASEMDEDEDEEARRKNPEEEEELEQSKKEDDKPKSDGAAMLEAENTVTTEQDQE